MKTMRLIYIVLFCIVHVIELQSLNVLHMSFHQGCINDFKEVARELGLNLTSWYILSADRDRTHFDGITRGNGVYNITHERAQLVWEKHKDYFGQFDVIITSDTAPLSRIFLQNRWQKPLIVWICNRFDYADCETSYGSFPDAQYYHLFANAHTYCPRIQIISYTPYEYLYANRRGIPLSRDTVKPIGTLPVCVNNSFISTIPGDINKQTTVFIQPRLPEYAIEYIKNECNKRGIVTYSGKYNGPEDVQDFKGIIFIPYAWSNLALFENLQRGIVHFVPTLKFMRTMRAQRIPIPVFASEDLEWCEWYQPEYQDLFVYFNSWDELADKIRTTHYVQLSQIIKERACDHRTLMLARWQEAFARCL